jgi:glutaredoxin
VCFPVELGKFSHCAIELLNPENIGVAIESLCLYCKAAEILLESVVPSTDLHQIEVENVLSMHRSHNELVQFVQQSLDRFFSC